MYNNKCTIVSDISSHFKHILAEKVNFQRNILIKCINMKFFTSYKRMKSGKKSCKENI